MVRNRIGKFAGIVGVIIFKYVKSVRGLKMKKRKANKIKTYEIKEGLFFKEDFVKMPENIMIYIKKGKVMLI